MYYHALARILGGYQVWKNMSQADLIRDVLVPFVNRWLLPVGYDRARAVMNLGAVTYLRIFQCANMIPDTIDAIQELNSERFAAAECTEEILRKAHLTYAWKESRSVLQAMLAPKVHRIFVVMKLNDLTLNQIYQNVIRPVADEYGYPVLRIDELENSEDITSQILEAITTSELVLCELSGERPNCYYETGFAHALGRELILTIQKKEQKHFDIASLKFIEWDTPDELKSGLRRRLEAIKQRKEETQWDKT